MEDSCQLSRNTSLILLETPRHVGQCLLDCRNQMLMSVGYVVKLKLHPVEQSDCDIAVHVAP